MSVLNGVLVILLRFESPRMSTGAWTWGIIHGVFFLSEV